MKHNDAVIRQYCRAVGKRLPLPAAQRRQLLTGLREELTEPARILTMRAGSQSVKKAPKVSRDLV